MARQASLDGIHSASLRTSETVQRLPFFRIPIPVTGRRGKGIRSEPSHKTPQFRYVIYVVASTPVLWPRTLSLSSLCPSTEPGVMLNF